MTTPCAIIKQRDDGKFYLSSIRSDGFLTGVGRILFKKYTDPIKVDALLNLGWVSPLEEEIEDMFGDTLEGEFPKSFETMKEACLYGVNTIGMVFVYQDSAWHYVRGKRYSEKKQFYSAISKPEKITIELLVNEKPSLATYLASSDKKETFREFMQRMMDQLTAQNDPNLEVFGNAAKGFIGFRYTSPGFDKE